MGPSASPYGVGVPEEGSYAAEYPARTFPCQRFDAAPEHHQKPQGISITLNVKEPQKAEQIFAALSEKAKVTMPIQKTFWSARFGMLVDQFGIPWMVNCEQAA